MERRANQLGETLIEVLISVVIMGMVVSAFFAMYEVASPGTTAQKNLVTGDGILRSYAEATIAAVRADCANGSTFNVSYVVPASDPGFSVTSKPSLSPQNCPAVTGSAAILPVQLFVQVPHIAELKELDIEVRAP